MAQLFSLGVRATRLEFMIKINLFLVDEIDGNPLLKLKFPTMPRIGDGFELESGIIYEVCSIWFTPHKNKSCSVNIAIENRSQIDGPTIIND